MADTAPIEISVVTPAYGTADCLPMLYTRLCETLERISPRFEILIVNDGSPQHDWQVIQELSRRDARVRGINLSRNFGQHTAITAGLDHARGRWVVVMDADLQDQPEEIARLYAKAQEGYEIVFGVRTNRQDSLLKRLLSSVFNKVFRAISNIALPPGISNFSISSALVIENFRKLRERNRAFVLIILWLGFRTGYVPIEHSARYAGRTTYTWAKAMKFAMESIVSQSDKPLRVSINVGLVTCLASALTGCYYVVRYFVHGISVPGWTTLIVSLFFLFGLLYANLGIIGLYLGRVFEESKHRPLYIICETANFPEDDALLPPVCAGEAMDED